MLIDQTEIYISDNYKFIPLVLLVIDFLFNLLWPFINQYQQQCCNKISKLDIDTLLSDFIFELLGYLFQRKLVNGLLGSLEMFNVNINISNNENDIQIISNILYHDMSVLLLSVGFTLFISLILLISNISYSFVFKKRNTLSNVDIYNLLENACMHTVIKASVYQML